MKASELVAKLQAIIDEGGDDEVVVSFFVDGSIDSGGPAVYSSPVRTVEIFRGEITLNA